MLDLTYDYSPYILQFFLMQEATPYSVLIFRRQEETTAPIVAARFASILEETAARAEEHLILALYTVQYNKFALLEHN